MKLKIDDKYSIVRQDNPYEFYATRYGERWRELVGDGLVLALVQHIEQTKALLKDIERAGSEPEYDEDCDGNEDYIGDTNVCPVCRYEYGHAPDCQLDKLLYEQEVG
jgi:hypothetical protein